MLFWNTTFFNILRPWAAVFPVFAESFFANFSKVHLWWPKSTIWGKGVVSRNIFSSLSHTQRKNFSLFEESSWHDSRKCTLRVQWICWTFEGKDFFWKKVFCTPFVDLERKKLGFRWTFSGVGSKFAIIVAEKTIWSRKLTFRKLLFDNFHTMKIFGTTYIYIFFIFVGHWAENVRRFAKVKGRGFQICTE